MPPVERRLAAIMFTDMVGYTALGQRNESLSLALVEEQRKLIRPVVTRHGGREVKTMGDAFLVEFSSALEGARCAYEIQRVTREYNYSMSEETKIHLRVGLHLGDVVESEGGDISGDAVNVASRIEAQVESGGICLTREFFEQVRNKFELPMKSIGTRTLKNVSMPVEVFRVVLPWEGETAGRSVALDPRRIAVLPFANMSPDAHDEYFADGMTEEIISTVSRVDQVEVISRTSVMQYKKAPKSVKEVSRELEVGTILEGSVRKAGDKFRIMVQMIDAARDRHIWVQSYDRDIRDVFAIQSEIAQKVADSLRLRLEEGQKQEIARGPTKNMAAYDDYLAGLHYLNIGGGTTGITKSLEYFQRAVASDPGFAEAYAALATAHIYLAGESLPPQEAFSHARDYALKALGLNDHLPEAHSARANLAFQADWDWDTADAEFRRGSELNPNSAPFWRDHALFLSLTGNDEEAIVEAHRAIALAPLSALESGVASVINVYRRRTQEALDFAKRKFRLEPDADAHTVLAFAYLAGGMIDEAYKELLRMRNEASPPSHERRLGWAGGLNPWMYAIVCTVLPTVNQEGALREILAEAEDYARESYVSRSDLAILHLGLGEQEQALALLEADVQNRDIGFVFVWRSHVFDSVRSSPRFTAPAQAMRPARTNVNSERMPLQKTLLER